MIYIAHRGLFDGPDNKKENHPDQIKKAISKGYQVEIDVRYIDKKLVLGHDEPQYEITNHFINSRKTWIHCKNIEALHYFVTHVGEKYNYFWHENDQYTLTSKNYIWTYPGKNLSDMSIMVMPEYADTTLVNTRDVVCYGICSDHVNKIKQDREKYKV